MENHLKNLKFPIEATARTAFYLIPAISAQVFLGHLNNPKIKEFRNRMSLWDNLKEIKNLYAQDQANISKGYYLAPEKIIPDIKNYLLMNVKNAFDLLKVKRRIKNKDVRVFDEKICPSDFPPYFRQSFHYQSDGYFSSDSAELYDHQVELVFTGTAQAMRRHGIKAISLISGNTNYPRLDKLKILDIACGTGPFTSELERHFPKSEIHGVDLSPWYLSEAQNKFPQSNIKWQFAKAEKLPFDDESFDIVSSVYLYHELPEKIRKQAAKEMLRVLKPGGTLVHIDSIQKGDVAELDVGLEVFPQAYHEPYFKNYISQNTEALFEKLGLQNVNSDYAFYSKIIRGHKKN